MELNLSKAMLDCMQNLRRRLRVEFNLDIHLNEPGAVEALLAACQKSDSVRTRELGMELAEMSGLPAAQLARQPEPAGRAGRSLTAGLFGSSAAAATADEGNGGKLVRIYRGQRVYG